MTESNISNFILDNKLNKLQLTDHASYTSDIGPQGDFNLLLKQSSNSSELRNLYCSSFDNDTFIKDNIEDNEKSKDCNLSNEVNEESDKNDKEKHENYPVLALVNIPVNINNIPECSALEDREDDSVTLVISSGVGSKLLKSNIELLSAPENAVESTGTSSSESIKSLFNQYNGKNIADIIHQDIKLQNNHDYFYKILGSDKKNVNDNKSSTDIIHDISKALPSDENNISLAISNKNREKNSFFEYGVGAQDINIGYSNDVQSGNKDAQITDITKDVVTLNSNHSFISDSNLQFAALSKLKVDSGSNSGVLLQLLDQIDAQQQSTGSAKVEFNLFSQNLGKMRFSCCDRSDGYRELTIETKEARAFNCIRESMIDLSLLLSQSDIKRVEKVDDLVILGRNDGRVAAQAQKDSNHKNHNTVSASDADNAASHSNHQDRPYFARSNIVIKLMMAANDVQNKDSKFSDSSNTIPLIELYHNRLKSSKFGIGAPRINFIA